MTRRQRKPGKMHQKFMLTKQRERCFYCGIPFSSYAIDKKKKTMILLNPTWDHVDPYSYTQSNRDLHFVAACPVCNQHKASTIFEHVNVCRLVLEMRRGNRYEYILPDGTHKRDAPISKAPIFKFIRRKEYVAKAVHIYS